MSHHHGGATGPLSEDAQRRRRRASLVITAFLLPIAVATIAGLVGLWPHHADRHLNQQVVTTARQGVTFIDGTVVQVRTVPCGSGSADVGADGISAEKPCNALTVRLTQGPEREQLTSVVVDDTVTAAGIKAGTQVILSRVSIPGQPAAYNYSDVQRGVPLGLLALAFVVVVVAVARWRGLRALIGLAFGGVVLLFFAMPAMISGSSPLLVGVVASLAIVYVVLYITHGLSARTSTALLGTIAGLAVAAVLARLVSGAVHLSGAASDNDFALHQSAPDLHLPGAVVCGMVIAGLGVLNDITVTQASAVWELAEAGVTARRTLYRRAMRIGRDHVASAVYTIAFVWAGASLSTLLLVSAYDQPLLRTAQSDLIATDIVSTLVGVVALVLATPLTTIIAVVVVSSSTPVSGSIDPANSAIDNAG